MSDWVAVSPAFWGDEADRAALQAIRRTVFIEEQHVPEPLEWDGLDAEANHLLARDPSGAAIGTARMLEDGHIGRLAVLPPWRRRGVGSALLQAFIDHARVVGLAQLVLNAQTAAIPFYEGFGFKAEGDVFMDAGIPHRRMTLSLNSNA